MTRPAARSLNAPFDTGERILIQGRSFPDLGFINNTQASHGVPL